MGTIVTESNTLRKIHVLCECILKIVIHSCTFLLLSTTAYIGVEFEGYGEGVELSNELVETMENRPDLALYFG